MNHQLGIPGNDHELIQHPAVTDCEKQLPANRRDKCSKWFISCQNSLNYKKLDEFPKNMYLKLRTNHKLLVYYKASYPQPQEKLYLKLWILCL